MHRRIHTPRATGAAYLLIGLSSACGLGPGATAGELPAERDMGALASEVLAACACPPRQDQPEVAPPMSLRDANGGMRIVAEGGRDWCGQNSGAQARSNAAQTNPLLFQGCRDAIHAALTRPISVGVFDPVVLAACGCPAFALSKSGLNRLERAAPAPAHSVPRPSQSGSSQSPVSSQPPGTTTPPPTNAPPPICQPRVAQTGWASIDSISIAVNGN